MKLIIQIPCLNETGSLKKVLDDLPTEIDGIDVIEVLVIDDGSTDGTSGLARKLGAHWVVQHRANRGLAAAFATGFEVSLLQGADIIVNSDGDHQYPGKYIAALVKPILDGRADIVIGDRNPSADLRFPWAKRCLQGLGRRVVSCLAGRELRDPVSGFRAFSREAACKLHIVTRYSYTIETLLQAIHKGLAVDFVPIETNAVARPSRLFKSIPHFVLRSATTLLRVFFMFHAFHVLVGLSGVLGVIGLLPIVRFLVLFAIGQGDGHVQSLILGGATLVLASLCFVAAMLSDLIAHNRRLMEIAIERTFSAQANMCRQCRGSLDEHLGAKPEAVGR